MRSYEDLYENHYDKAYDGQELADKLEMINETLEVMMVALTKLAEGMETAPNLANMPPVGFKIGADLGVVQKSQNAIAKGFGNV
ncbi:MAG: hypothetical protein FWE33_01755 [Defluviitaleaceae bacterium]|nr:hypothetical protein [Defluviitaleaceae bacterium]